jgi:hypothetical protein
MSIGTPGNAVVMCTLGMQKCMRAAGEQDAVAFPGNEEEAQVNDGREDAVAWSMWC